MEEIEDRLATRLWGGRELEKRGNWKGAASVYQRLWDQGESTNARVAYKLGHACFRLDNLDLARITSPVP